MNSLSLNSDVHVSSINLRGKANKRQKSLGKNIVNFIERGVKVNSHGCAALKGSSRDGSRVAPPAKDSGLW